MARQRPGRHVASLFSIRTSVVSGGVLGVMGTAVLGLILAAFRHYSVRMGRARDEAEERGRAAELKPST
jgi:hypothetical protein